MKVACQKALCLKTCMYVVGLDQTIELAASVSLTKEKGTSE